MDAETIDRHKVRASLDAELRTDEDLDAFCVDFFPEVYRRFSTGMQRPAKTSLLLTLFDAELVADKLRQQTDARQTTTPRARRCHWGYAVAAVVALGIGGGVSEYRLWPWDAGQVVESGAGGNLQVDAMVEDLGQSSVASRPSGNIVVDHNGDIRSKGNIRIMAPAAPGDTVVKSKGQINAQGDVSIGVMLPAVTTGSKRAMHTTSQKR